MNLPDFRIDPAFAGLVNHLWQSAMVVGASWLMTIALRKNHARTRYWVWMVASVKFLVPFSVLVCAGEWLRTLVPAPMARPALASVMEQVTQPFSQMQVLDQAGPAVGMHHAGELSALLPLMWACGAAVVVCKFALGWMRIYAAKRGARPIEAWVPSGAKAPDSISNLNVRAKARTLQGVKEVTEELDLRDRRNAGAKAQNSNAGICGTTEVMPCYRTSSAITDHAAGVVPLQSADLFDADCTTKIVPFFKALQRPALVTSSLLEPGIFGVFRPVLLMPEGILERLSAEQLRAIVAHELCHVRRRDNLTFALHMIVEAVFWFFPPVWWIGARLIEERERACDEAVLDQGSEAQVYAEGILNVCKFYVEAPVACAAGVTGSDLKKRIVRIMTEHVTHKLDLRRKLLLGAMVLVALAVPLTAGLVRVVEAGVQSTSDVTAGNLPRFDVVSVKAHKDEGTRMMSGIRMTPDGVNTNGVPLRMIVRQAFGVSDDRILNEPEWVKSNRYDIEAKVDAADVARLNTLSFNERWAMFLPVLQERFGLNFHHETKEMEVYTLVQAKGGSKMQESKDQEPDAKASAGPDGKPAPGPDPKASMGKLMMNTSSQGMQMEGRGVPMSQIVAVLSMQLGSTVVDKTGLIGKYDYTMNFAPDRAIMPMGGPEGGPPGAGPESAPADAPSLFTALEDQLGLKLVAQKEPVDVIVIDHIEQPSPN